MLREILRVKGDAFNSCVLSEKLPTIARYGKTGVRCLNYSHALQTPCVGLFIHSRRHADGYT